jgi:hypothetical protein
MRKATNTKAAKVTKPLLVPYSVRPDRIERGLRILRALRLQQQTPAAPSAKQTEFQF